MAKGAKGPGLGRRMMQSLTSSRAWPEWCMHVGSGVGAVRRCRQEAPFDEPKLQGTCRVTTPCRRRQKATYIPAERPMRATPRPRSAPHPSHRGASPFRQSLGSTSSGMPLRGVGRMGKQVEQEEGRAGRLREAAPHSCQFGNPRTAVGAQDHISTLHNRQAQDHATIVAPDTGF